MADTGGWQRICLWLGVTLTGSGGAWLVAWGVAVAESDAPQSRPFWIAATYIAVAVFLVGTGLVAVGELGFKRAPASVLRVNPQRERLGEFLSEGQDLLRMINREVSPHRWSDAYAEKVSAVSRQVEDWTERLAVYVGEHYGVAARATLLNDYGIPDLGSWAFDDNDVYHPFPYLYHKVRNRIYRLQELLDRHP